MHSDKPGDNPIEPNYLAIFLLVAIAVGVIVIAGLMGNKDARILTLETQVNGMIQVNNQLSDSYSDLKGELRDAKAELRQRDKYISELEQANAKLDALLELFQYNPDIDLSPELQAYTTARCLEMGLDRTMVYAVMEHESSFRVDAINYNSNGTIDTGLMQINSVNWGWLADQGIDVHTPRGNIDAGILMLSDLTGRHGFENGLAAYAAGEGGMRKGRGKWFSIEIQSLMT